MARFRFDSLVTRTHTMQALFGAAALSEFKTSRLLATLQAAVPSVLAIDARFLHLVESSPLTDGESETLNSLLRYGEELHGTTESFQATALSLHRLVVPRKGTLSRPGLAKPPISYITAASKMCAECSEESSIHSHLALSWRLMNCRALIHCFTIE